MSLPISSIRSVNAFWDSFIFSSFTFSRAFALDVENADRLRRIEHLHVLGGADEIAGALRSCQERPRE